jgi:hypothetical protein
MLFIYSYWIFAWFILFLLNIIPYNPFIFIIIAYILTLFELLYIYLKNANKYNLIKFFIINIIIKLIPILILIYLNKITIKYNDIYFGILLLFTYLFFMIILNINPFTEYNKVFDTYINDDNKNKSIFSKFYDYIYFS